MCKYVQNNRQDYMKRILIPNFIFTTLAFLFMVSLSSCWKNKNATQIDLNLSLVWNGVATSIGDTVLYQETMPLRLEKFKCYIDNISIRNIDGNWISSGSIDLLEFLQTDELTTAEFAASEMKRGVEIDAIRFGIGVDPFYNLLDNAPITFANDHPLGTVGGAGMYWTWETGYIFTKFEGKVALSEGEAFTHPFAFHTGTDDLYREVIIELQESVCIAAEELHEFNISIDLNSSIASSEDEIDLLDNAVTHTLNNVELAERYVNLLDNAWMLAE